MEGLWKLYGGKGSDQIEEFRTEAANYTHIQACGPGGIAEADGGFALKFLEYAEARAKIDPVGKLSFPSDFVQGDWRPGQLITSGGKDFSLPYDFDGIDAKDVIVVIEPPKIDIERNLPKDVKKQKQDENEKDAEEPGC